MTAPSPASDPVHVQVPSAERLTVPHEYLQAAYRRDSLIIVLAPTIGFVTAAVWAVLVGVSTLDLGLIVVMYTLASFGIDVGYHRYFAHRAFKATPVMRAIMAVSGAMAAQGRLIRWVANHRRHHAYSDQPSDPHSPHAGPWSGATPGPLRRLRHAHVSWIFTHEPSNAVLFCRDLLGDPMLALVNRYYLACLLAAVLAPAAVAGVWTRSWSGAAEGVLFGWAVPVFLSQQAAFCVNSIGHFFGRRPFATDDQSTNVAWLAVPSIGASWQNNHHAFPSAAVTGIEWWQLDVGGWILRVLAACGLVWDLNRPNAAAILARRGSHWRS